MAVHKIKLVNEKTEKEYTAEEIENFMVICKTQKRLADLLGVDQDTITNTKAISKEFSDAIAKGKRRATQSVIKALFEMAEDKDLGAIKYVLNNVESDEWADKTKVESKIEVTDHSKILSELESA